MLNHRGYLAVMEVDEDAGIIHGEVINTKDVITFQGETVKEATQAFIDSVEDYLAFCAERGEEPEKPFNGRFLLRLEPEEHRQLYMQARHAKMSLNEFIRQKLLSS